MNTCGEIKENRTQVSYCPTDEGTMWGGISLINNMFSFHRDYFAEDEGEMVPRTSHAAGKEAVGLTLINS